MKKFLLGFIICAVAFKSFDTLALYTNKDVTATPLLKTTSTWNGAAIAYPSGTPEVSAMIVEIAVGGETGWHLHTAPSVAIILEGEIVVELKDGKSKHFKKGDALAEVVNTLHNGKNKGTVPAKLAVFYAGASGLGLTVSEDPATKPAL
jgi:quercetin dioxygenase-like cupin family protein